jgi:hypothetical protein
LWSSLPKGRQKARFFAARFFSLALLSRAFSFSKSAFDTFRTLLSALLSRSAGVLPGTFGAGRDLFMRHYDSRNAIDCKFNRETWENG